MLALVMVLAIVGVAGAAAKKKKAAPAGPPPDLPGHVSYLAWKLRGLHLDESGEITGQIQKMVLDHLQQWLGDRAVTGVELRRELENVFAKVRYPIVATPKCFAMSWKGATLMAAGYTLGWTANNRINLVALFEHREGKNRLLAVTPFVPYTDLNYEFVPRQDRDDFWFFVYGYRPGKSQLRLTAILYAYDGQALKPLWEVREIHDGKMQVGQDRVTIRYLKEEEYVREIPHGRKPPRHEAVYKFTPQGLELELDHEIPF